MAQAYPWNMVQWPGMVDPNVGDLNPGMMAGPQAVPRPDMPSMFASIPPQDAPQAGPPLPPMRGPEQSPASAPQRPSLLASVLGMGTANAQQPQQADEGPNWLQKLSMNPLVMGGIMTALDASRGGSGVEGFKSGAGTAAGIQEAWMKDYALRQQIEKEKAVKDLLASGKGMEGVPAPLLAIARATQDPAMVAKIIAEPGWKLTDGPRNKYGNPIKVWANERTQEVKPVLGGIPAAATADNAATLHGEEFLKTLDPTIAAQVKGIAEGKLPYPGAFALKQPYWQKVTEALSQYEPNADANTFKTRAATYRDMAVGTMGKNVASFNTALGHMYDLYKQIDGLDNSSTPLLNKPINMARAQVSDAYQAKRDTFNATASKVIAETERAFKGMGATVSDMQHARDELNADKTPASLKATVRKYLDLMESRLHALHDQYDRGMALGQPRQGLHLLTPQSRKIIEDLKGEAVDGNGNTASGGGWSIQRVN